MRGPFFFFFSKISFLFHLKNHHSKDVNCHPVYFKFQLKQSSQTLTLISNPNPFPNLNPKSDRVRIPEFMLLERPLFTKLIFTPAEPSSRFPTTHPQLLSPERKEHPFFLFFFFFFSGVAVLGWGGLVLNGQMS